MPTVTISTTNEQFNLPKNAYLSDAAELQLAGLIFGCRAGGCGICAIDVIDGIGNLSPRDELEAHFLASLGHVADTHRLACQCQLLGDITIRHL
ncbi:(2Fe-2S)-binding protein [Trinickia violacea]|uniref:(2Fe-2S)-binding protein n=1 Tax=Trinickia violacea TaxID=2571746 RepID=A0A4P8IYU4_9BURK|nr:2Fe-2S iron-sulfur cluster-binding protein [Trinickia violacea]QCP54522.1 (2Fe-2S)-binding protein [Trinickia violacea]